MYTTADISTSGFDSYSLTLQIFLLQVEKDIGKKKPNRSNRYNQEVSTRYDPHDSFQNCLL